MGNRKVALDLALFPAMILQPLRLVETPPSENLAKS